MKLNPAVDRIAPATPKVPCTITGAKELGIICFNIILVLLAPIALAASINSWSLIESTEALTIRAKFGTYETLIEIIRFNILGPNAETIAIASNILGTAKKISTTLIIILSIKPPKYPDIAPKIPPTTTEIDIAKIPTFNETLAPWISLANISLRCV